jgi:predicted transcriptional regulator
VNNRRTQYEIYWEILTFCKTPRSITQIIQRCNLNSKIGQDYINFLESKGYLTKTNDNNKSLYLTTPTAKGFVDIFMKLYLEVFRTTPEFRL